MNLFMGNHRASGITFLRRTFLRFLRYFGLSAVVLLAAQAALRAATPSLILGSTSTAAGTLATIPITFDPGTASVASMQFNITLPSSLTASTSTVVAGAILNNAGKLLNNSVSGQTWTFLIFGLNQNTIAAGQLATIQMAVAAGTGTGTLSLPISNVVYSDPNGNTITPGTSTNGSVVVGAPLLQLTKSSSVSNAKSGDSVTFTIQYQNQGNVDATSVTLTDAIPAGTTFITGSITGGGTLNSGIIQWSIPVVPAQSAAQQVSFQVKVN